VTERSLVKKFSPSFSLLAINGVLLGYLAWSQSPTVQEAVQLPAGLSHYDIKTFEISKVNPPLVRLWASIPVKIAGAKTDWRVSARNGSVRAEREVGIRFLKANRSRVFGHFFVSRLFCIPIVLMGGYVCSRWARELYGKSAGVICAFLWTFSPYVLGYGSLMSADMHAACIGVLSAYIFWRWLTTRDFLTASFAGITLGLAQLSKFTFVTFYPVWILLFLISLLKSCKQRQGKQRTLVIQFLLIGIMSIFVINTGYGFEGSLTPCGVFEFSSQSFKDTFTCFNSLSRRVIGNFGADDFLSRVPIPLPKNYLQGIDIQKHDFEHGLQSYLNGVWSNHGWWYFYLYVVCIKTPLGTILLGFIALTISVFFRDRSTRLIDELSIVLPFVCVFLFVSSQTGFSIHPRYILPALPFVTIWISKVGAAFNFRGRLISKLVVFLLIWFFVSNAIVYPHSLSFFNEVVGGPCRGYEHLVDSSISCGQDFLYLFDWRRRHPEVERIHLAAFGPVDPSDLGIEFELPPVGPFDMQAGGSDIDTNSGPCPGWHIVDVNYLAGTRLPALDGNGGKRYFLGNNRNFQYFQLFTPTRRIGYSFCVYNITLEEANRVRLVLGLPEID